MVLEVRQYYLGGSNVKEFSGFQYYFVSCSGYYSFSSSYRLTICIFLLCMLNSIENKYASKKKNRGKPQFKPARETTIREVKPIAEILQAQSQQPWKAGGLQLRQSVLILLTSKTTWLVGVGDSSAQGRRAPPSEYNALAKRLE